MSAANPPEDLPPPRGPGELTLVRRRRPPLNQASRLLTLLAFVITIVLVLLVILAASSLVLFVASLKSDQFVNSRPSLQGGNTLVFGGYLLVRNGGFMPVTAFQVASHLYLPNGQPLQNLTPAPISIAAGGEANLSTTLQLSFTSGPARSLLTHDHSSQGSELSNIAYINGTEFGLLGLSVRVLSNVSWGAPFANLSQTLTNPTPLGNGTTEVTVLVSFVDHFNSVSAVGGNLTLEVRSSSGAVCATTQMIVYALQQQTFSQSSLPLYLPSSCTYHGGSIASTLSGGVLDVALPVEGIP